MHRRPEDRQEAGAHAGRPAPRRRPRPAELIARARRGALAACAALSAIVAAAPRASAEPPPASGTPASPTRASPTPEAAPPAEERTTPTVAPDIAPGAAAPPSTATPPAGSATATPPTAAPAAGPTPARADDPLAKLQAQIDALARARDDDDRRRDEALKLGGYVQVDWVLHRQSSQDEINGTNGQPLNEDRFLLRRGHLRATLDRGLLSGALEIDANTVNGPQVRPIDAEVSLRWPAARDAERPIAMLTLGLMKIPFGFEVPELDNVRPFLERSNVARALFPGEFDLGARLMGSWRGLEWALAAMNGDPIGDRTFPGRDPNQSKDLVARVGVDASIVRDVRVQAGISGVTGMGFHAGTPSTKDVLVWRDVNEDGIVQPTEIQVIPGSAATASQNFHRFALGADLRVTVRVPTLGDLVLRGEVVRGANLDRGLEPADPIAAGHDLREIGWHAGFTQEITRWGMIGVRFDRYDPDADASESVAGNLVPRDRTYSTIAFMGMLRYATGRLVLEYDKNGNALGRDASGAPTTLKDDALTLRGQVTF